MWVQRFRDGEAGPMQAEAFNAVFGQYIDKVDPECSFFHLIAPDGGDADVYARMLPELDSVMISRFSNGQILDLVVEFARTTDAVILPVGCATCVVDSNQIPHLPEELHSPNRQVSSGSDLEAVIAEG